MELRERLAAMIAKATDGAVEAAEILSQHARLADLGVTSLAFLRLIDLVEAEFGVDVDPADLGTLDDLAALLEQHG